MAGKYKYRFTVFTATHNNAEKIVRSYESLTKQTFRDFEWLVVDDGSKDNTKEVVEELAKKADFPVRYIYQEHSHKVVAINRAVENGEGELYAELDSDDELTPNSLERMDALWKELEASGKASEFCSVAGLCNDQNGVLVGEKYPEDHFVSDSWTLLAVHHVTGEKFGTQRMDVMKEFPFPEDVKGHRLPPSLVWWPMGRKYKTLYVNEVLRIYYRDAESATTTARPWKNAVGGQRQHQMVLNDFLEHLWKNPKLYLKSAAAFSRYSFHVGKKAGWQFGAIKPLMGKVLLLAGVPAGYLFYKRDLEKDKKRLAGASKPVTS